MQARVGDRVLVRGRQVGAVERHGEIVEVHGSEGAPPYLVRWADGHEALLLLAVFSFLILTGCQKENSIVSPVSEKSGWEGAAKAQGLHLISLPENAVKSLNKNVLFCEELVRTNNVSVLKIENRYKAENGNDVKIKAELKILKNSLTEDQTIRMSLDDQTLMTGVDLTFGPSGTSFNPPALLNVTAQGLDLSDMKPTDHIKLVLLNEKDEVIGYMNAKEISFDIKKGEIRCVDGQLPHFSRYGFTRIDGSEEPAPDPTE